MIHLLKLKYISSLFAVCCLGLSLWTGSVLAEDEANREVIGEVLGEVVYRDQIAESASKSKDWLAMNREMSRLFLAKPMQQYRESVADEIEPTENELESMHKRILQLHAERMLEQEPKIRAELEAIENKLADVELDAAERKKLLVQQTVQQQILTPPPKSTAEFVLTGWKYQKHIHDNFGGGRSLWQQFGIEAFDATRRLIEDLEKKGKFRIDDPQLRSELYKYWTGQESSPHLRGPDDKEGNGFQTPPWETQE